MRLVLVAICSLVISGCATVFSGYTSELVIHNVPDSLRVLTSDGVKLAKSFDQTRLVRIGDRRDGGFHIQEETDSTSCSVQLRSNRDYVLLLQDGNKENRYPAYAKLNGWWFALDLVCGGIPIIVDGITGNWNYYDPIYFKK
jgi:hypothetical protein